jgi:hypothetical protein
MRLSRRLLGALLVPAACAAATRPLSAQARVDAPGTGGECTYSACALNIAPRWNGLAVVRGSDGPPLANLHFFWPRDITPSLRGPSTLAPGADSAAAQARRAIRLRRIGAALTDAGIVAGAVGAIGALRAGRVRSSDGILLGAGGTALAISVPFQFAADGALSRAVWWHNRRYAR